MSVHTRQVCFQIPPEDTSTDMLEWLAEHHVHLPDLPGLRLFRMSPDTAERFTARFPGSASLMLE